YYKITNGSCTDSAKATIKVVTKPEAGNDTCLSLANSLTLNANISDIHENGYWSANEGFFNDPAVNSTGYSNSSAGTHNLKWAISDSTNTCTASDSITVTTITPPDAGTDTCIILPQADLETPFTLKGDSYN